jgi:hypothetical protein
LNYALPIEVMPGLMTPRWLISSVGLLYLVELLAGSIQGFNPLIGLAHGHICPVHEVR